MDSPPPPPLQFQDSRYNFISKEIHDSELELGFQDGAYLLSPLLGQNDTVKQNLITTDRTKSTGLNQDDRIIFDELRAYIFQGDWESLLVKLIETPDFPIDSQDTTHRNFTLLHHACLKKKVDCVRVLVNDFGASPNIKADNGWTSLHTLVFSDCRCKSCCDQIILCLQILLENGEAHVDAEDDLGETPLYLAARNRLSQPATFLLSYGADINHWVNGTSVSTLLAQYVPDVLKAEFDKRITVQNSTDESLEGVHRALRLDFRLLLQEPAIHEGFTTTKPSRSRHRKGKRNLPARLRHEHKSAVSHIPDTPFPKKREGSNRIRTSGDIVTVTKERREPSDRNNGKLSPASLSPSSSSSTLPSVPPVSSSCSVPPTETELLNYLLKADLPAIEAVVNHPLVEAFVHLKWLSVRRLFFILRSLYLFLISLYTFYVFDTFVNATCFYNPSSASSTAKVNPSGSSSVSNNISPRFPRARSIFAKPTTHNDDESVVKATFGVFIPTAAMEGTRENQKSPYYFHSFAEYFKAHEMTCEWRMRTQIMAYLFAAFALGVVLYELYKMFEGWYDYYKEPLNWGWWVLAFSISVTLAPGLGLYAHSWLYAFAAFTLVYGWILLLAQIARIPYFGIFVGIFVKVVRDFCVLLFTFSPLLLAFALGFSVMLPQNEYFRFIPVAVFKVFLMMTGDVDFWGVFKGTWTDAEHQGHIYIPLFIIYTVYILMVTMVLMSLLLGLAVDNIQEVRREAALFRTVRLIQEIGIFESMLQKPAIYYCGCSRFLRRMFSITSLKYMNGPELITFPEDPEDETLPPEIKQKLIRYLTSSCCSASDNSDRNNSCDDKGKKKRIPHKYKPGFERNPQIEFKRENRDSEQFISGKESSTHSLVKMREMRRKFFEEPQLQPQMTKPDEDEREKDGRRVSDSKLNRDVAIYEELKLLLADNEKMRIKLESLKRTLLLNMRR